MPRAPRVSPTSRGLSSRVFDALRTRARERSGPVFPLHVGDTWREPPEAARSEALRTADHPLLHAYAPPHGDPALLDVLEARLSERAGRTVDRADIQVVAGATGGLSVACQTLLDPGDEVIVPTPCWPLITGIIASRGAVAVQAPFAARLGDDGFDLEGALECSVTPRTAAVYVNSPHNPTGHVWTDDEIDALSRVARRHDLWVISDEVYEDLWYGDTAPPRLLARDDLRDRLVATHSVSKTYGLAGARIGWTVGPREGMAALRAVLTQQVYCAARPMQALAVAALTQGSAWLDATRRDYAMAARKTAMTLGQPAPAAGTFVFFDATPWLGGGDDALPFLERCLDAGVLLTPGTACGRDFAAWARVCFTSVKPTDLDEALARLRAIVDGTASVRT